MPNCDPRDGFFYPNLTLMITYFCLAKNFSDHLWICHKGSEYSLSTDNVAKAPSQQTFLSVLDDALADLSVRCDTVYSVGLCPIALFVFLRFRYNLSLGGWEDGFIEKDNNPYPRDTLNNSDVIAYSWDNVWEWGAAARAYRMANKGYKVRLGHHTSVGYLRIDFECMCSHLVWQVV